MPVNKGLVFRFNLIECSILHSAMPLLYGNPAYFWPCAYFQPLPNLKKSWQINRYWWQGCPPSKHESLGAKLGIPKIGILKIHDLYDVQKIHSKVHQNPLSFVYGIQLKYYYLLIIMVLIP